MAKFQNPYELMLERLQLLDHSIHVLNLVNSDLREILHKRKPLPAFIQESFKRPAIQRTRSSPALPPPLPPPQPIESEEMRVAASIIDKAKRTIETVVEKKPKPSSNSVLPTPIPLPVKITQNKRPTSASSNNAPSSSDSSMSQRQQPSVRRFIPAHLKAPFQTQPERKRRPSASIRSVAQTNSVPSMSTGRRRSLSQQPLKRPETPALQIETNPVIDDQQNIAGPDQIETVIHSEPPTSSNNGASDVDLPVVTPPVELNSGMLKPLRRLLKHNQSLRARLEHELAKKAMPTPAFIDRLNQQIHSSKTSDTVHVPNMDALLQLAIKLRAITLHLLESSPFNDLESALQRLNTLKQLVHRYHYYFSANLNILVTKHHHRPRHSQKSTEGWVQQPTEPTLSKCHLLRYHDDSQLVAFTDVRFQQFENECRRIELAWHEQMIARFKQSAPTRDPDPLPIYRELMSLVTGLQTSTPIVVENRT